MKFEFISIVIPVYNVESLILFESLESLRTQTFTSFEVIIIDDSTSLRCSEFCKNFCASDDRFRYFKPKNKLGLSKSLNYGISLSKGALIARFDSDDICYSNRLDLQIKYINENPNIDVLGGNMQIICNEGSLISIRKYPLTHKKIFRKMQIDCAIAHPTVIFKKELVQKYKGYDENLLYAEDIDLWLRWLNNGVKFENLNKTLIKYRQNEFIRKRKHYKNVLIVRLSNFNLQLFPHKILGILLLIFAIYTPKSLLGIYYKIKYKI